VLTIPLKHLATLCSDHRRSEPGHVLTLDVIESGTGAVTGDAWNERSEPPDTGVADVEAGDVLFGKLRPYLAKVLLTSAPAYASTELLCLRPRPAVDPRWFAYQMLSRPVVDWAVATSEGTRMPRTSWERLGQLPVAAPLLREQRAIADFLDAETARTDALIAKKRQLLELTDERERSAGEEWLRSDEQVPVRRVAALLPGYTFPSTEFSPDFSGARLLRGVNVGVGAIRWDDCVRLDGQGAEYRRYVLAPGDLVLGMDRPFISGGTRVAEIRQPDSGSLLVQRVCRLRLEALGSTIIRWALRSRRFLAHVEPDLTGVSVPHLSEEQIGSFPVPVFSEGEEQARADRLRTIERAHEKLSRDLHRQITLLQERRQALITAAVTGELDIPGVAA